jgi:hypothetical protein
VKEGMPMPISIDFSIALSILATQLCGLYLRYLPFHSFLTPLQKKQLKTGYFIWAVTEPCLLTTLLITGLIPFSVLFWKFVMIIGWVPFFLINLLFIPHKVPQHMFILGIQCIYTFALHIIVSSLLLLLIPPENLVIWAYGQCIGYVFLFFLTVRVIKQFFKKIFITYRDADNNYYWRQICIIPLLLYTNNVLFVINDDFLNWTLLPSQLILVLCTALICYCILLDLKWIQNKVDLQRHNQALKTQVKSYKSHAIILQDAQKKMAILRHDTRHHTRILYSLIQNGKNKEALRLLESLEGMMDRTKVQSFCKNVLINAVLSFYIFKAQKENIIISYEIAVPEDMSIDDADLATVLSNLLENAIHAVKGEIPSMQKIQLILQIDDERMKLMIKNCCSHTVTLGRDGLPVTTTPGHGIGMRSITVFAQYYNAIVLCTQKDGWFITYLAKNP